MISRLTAFATTFSFAVAAAAAMTFSAQAQAPAAPAKAVRIIELPRVVVVAKQDPNAQ